MKALFFIATVLALTLSQNSFAGGGIKIGNGPFNGVECRDSWSNVTIIPTESEIRKCEKAHDSIQEIEQCICKEYGYDEANIF